VEAHGICTLARLDASKLKVQTKLIIEFLCINCFCLNDKNKIVFHCRAVFSYFSIFQYVYNLFEKMQINMNFILLCVSFCKICVMYVWTNKFLTFYWMGTYIMILDYQKIKSKWILEVNKKHSNHEFSIHFCKIYISMEGLF
jgi:hypothetical protein